MRKKYRSHLGVLLDILRVIAEDPDPTVSRIILLANIPHTRLKSFLEKLEAGGYIVREESGGRTTFRLTEKGFVLLEYLQKLEKLMSGLGMPL